MSILINKDTKVITQGITGKTGQFHTRACREYANGREAYVAGVNPKKAGEDFEGIPIYASVKEAKAETGATVSVIYVPPAGAAAAIWEAVEADLDLAICITEGIPVRDMLEITRAAAGEGDDAESDEAAYAELVEYLRVAAQLTYEELAEIRQPAAGDDEADDAPEVLH